MKHKILKKDLKIGNTIPIYLNFKEQKDFRGHAILIERLLEREPSKDQTAYEFAEIKADVVLEEDRKKDPIQIVYHWQWWKIKFVDGPEKDFMTAVKIAYYQITFWQKNNENKLKDYTI